jgi:hypothetical protein
MLASSLHSRDCWVDLRRFISTGISTLAKITNAAWMAHSSGIDPDTFREALRDADFPWYEPGTDWTVELGSPQHEAMRTVMLLLLLKRKQVTPEAKAHPPGDC